MKNKLFLNLKDNQVVLFADILGFGNAVKENENVSFHDQGDLIVDFEKIYDHILRSYSEEYQQSLGIKFLWVSDSIIVSTPIENANAIFSVLIDIINILYCSGLSLRGVITVGRLYHQNNVWGPALVEAAKDEKGIVKYPRIMIKESYFKRLPLKKEYRDYFKISNESSYRQFDYFDFYFHKLINEDKSVLSTLRVYSEFIKRGYDEAKQSSYKEKYIWLAEELQKAIRKYAIDIDNYLAKNNRQTILIKDTEEKQDHTAFIKLLKLTN